MCGTFKGIGYNEVPDRVRLEFPDTVT